jgi:hypothetical protein
MRKVKENIPSHFYSQLKVALLTFAEKVVSPIEFVGGIVQSISDMETSDTDRKLIFHFFLPLFSAVFAKDSKGYSEIIVLQTNFIMHIDQQ